MMQGRRAFLAQEGFFIACGDSRRQTLSIAAAII